MQNVAAVNGKHGGILKFTSSSFLHGVVTVTISYVIIEQSYIFVKARKIMFFLGGGPGAPERRQKKGRSAGAGPKFHLKRGTLT